MKTETITIRVTPQAKKLISNLAWVRRKSVSDLLTDLAFAEMSKLQEEGYPMPPQSVMDAEYELKKKLKSK